MATGTQWVVLQTLAQVDPCLPTPECPFPLAPCSTPPHSLHPSDPDHHVLPQLPPGTLHCSASLWPHRAWFDSPSAPPGILLSRVTFSGTFSQTRVILGPGPAALGLTEEGQRPTHPTLGLEAPGGVPVARDEGRGWEEACPPAWVKLLEKKGSPCGPFCPCPHSFLLTWDRDMRLGVRQPSLDHRDRAQPLR